MREPAREPDGGQAESARPASLLRERDYVLVWAVSLAMSVVRWLEVLAIGVYGYQLTQSAFLVTLLGMARMVPMALLSLWIAHLADRLARRTGLVLTIALQLACAAAVTALALAGELVLWHLAIASFVSGIAWASDSPIRRMLIGEIVGQHRMGRAMAIDVASNNACRMLGPAMGGALLAALGIAGAFGLGAILYLAALLTALAIRRRGITSAAGHGSTLSRLLAGLAIARASPRLVGVLLVTVIFNMFGWPYTSLVPVVAQDQLMLGPVGIGLLAALDGAGSLTGAVAIALFAREASYAAIYAGGVALFLVTLVAFALATDPVLAGVALFLNGLGGAGFAAMQTTLVYLWSPPELRGRMLGVLGLCIGVSPLGFLQVALLTRWLSAETTVVAIGAAGLLALALTWRWWRPILKGEG